MTVAFCGHSLYQKTDRDLMLVEDFLEDRLEKGENVEFFLGAYGGFDEFSYSCARRYKASHSQAKMILVTPYLDMWHSGKMLHHQNEYDLILYPELERVPKRYSIHRRNRWVAERADIIIAYITHSYGGAYEMYRHAVKKGKEIYNLADGYPCGEIG